MLGRLGLPAMVDTSHNKAESKNWQDALDALKAEIGKAPQPD